MGLTLHYNPTVYVVGDQRLLEEEIGEFIDEHTAGNWHPETMGTQTELEKNVAVSEAQDLIELAGRTCYMSFDKPRPGGNSAYIKHILEVGHGSVLEHAVFNFIITGVSRTLTHELVRHRAGWAYSQLSQRYVDESACDVVVPSDLADEVKAAEGALNDENPEWKTNPLAEVSALLVENWPKDGLVYQGLTWLRSVLRDNLEYVDKVKYLMTKKEITHVKTLKDGWVPRPTTEARKAARGAARSVLPNATETKIFCTVNARAIRHFLEMRCAAPAEVEIRKVAYAIWTMMATHSPNLFGDYKPIDLPDGTYALETPYRKV